MPTRPCAQPNCPNPATHKGRCPTHARTNNQTTTRTGYHIYRTKRWQTTRAKQLHDHPLCQCGCGQIATDVDHINPLNQGGNPWSPANLQSLADNCHGRKTRQEQLAR